MFGKHFILNNDTISVIEEIGRHMPGGFFIYKAEGGGELLYANHTIFDIFGCKNLDVFKELTGYSFKGMVHPDDYESVKASIKKQIFASEEKFDYVEYRIKCRDGSIRWVDNYGHYAETDNYGGIYYVFISDITEKHERLDNERNVHESVIKTLINSYEAFWLINDIETESCSLYRGDTGADSLHAAAIGSALSCITYTEAKDQYISNLVEEEDRERLSRECSLSYIVNKLSEKPQFSVTYRRSFADGPRYYRVDFDKVKMPGGKIGVIMGFKDVDDEVRAAQKAQQEMLEAKEENQRLMQQVESAAEWADLVGSAASLISNMPSLSFSKDAETGVYVACNQAFAEYAHKASPEDVIGLTDKEIFDPDTAAHFIEDDRKAVSMDAPYIFFEDVPNAAGTEIRNLQTTKMKYMDRSGRLCTLGMCVDVTEMTRIKSAEAVGAAKRQELEERLALQEKLLAEQRRREQQDKMITALASDYRSVYHVDLDKNDGVCYRCDPNDSEQTGEGIHFPYLERFTWYAEHSVAESYREGFLKFIDPENIKKRLEHEQIIAYRYLARRVGKEYYEMIRVAGVRHAEDRDDHLVHAVGLGLTVIDEEMRESMAKNQSLAEALAAAEEANKAKTAFLSNMSHEIRTPMNAIIGLGSLALHNNELSPETRRCLEKISSSARHLLGLINDILDMSRIESGRITLR
ncbi:PAS domain S-box protein, partial [bacterium]|nr:PAS domain S-box protein [bacterium]